MTDHEHLTGAATMTAKEQAAEALETLVVLVAMDDAEKALRLEAPIKAALAELAALKEQASSLLAADTAAGGPWYQWGTKEGRATPHQEPSGAGEVPRDIVFDLTEYPARWNCETQEWEPLGLSFSEAQSLCEWLAPQLSTPPAPSLPGREIADLLTSLQRLGSDFPNYGDWDVALPAGHWRAIRDFFLAGQKETP